MLSYVKAATTNYTDRPGHYHHINQIAGENASKGITPNSKTHGQIQGGSMESEDLLHN